MRAEASKVACVLRPRGFRGGLRAATLCVLAGCAHAASGPAPRVSPSAPKSAPGAQPAQLGAIEYTFRVDPGLRRIDARACFTGFVPAELVSGVQGGGKYLERAFTLTDAGARELPVVEHRIELQDIRDGGCASYSVDVGAAADGSAGLEATLRDGALVSNVALWLWRPPHWEGLHDLTARVELPEGMQASLPWPLRGDHYVLDRSALAFYAFAVFGHFEVEHIAAPGAMLDVAILDGLPPGTRSHVVPWLVQASRAAALALGHFPRPEAQVVVIPSREASEPVRFGTMNRGGGASAAILLPVNAQLEPLLHDWVAVHEFCHLLLPFIERDDAWLSEGLATYYQEVLRVRAGMESEPDAWRRLYEGSLLGRGAKNNLSVESADMFANFSFKMVYWAGASFALMSDVELRRRTHGRLCLDDVMRELADSPKGEPRAFRAREVVERLDRIAGVPVFSELMKRWVEGPTLPDLSALYQSLGLAVGSDGVRMADAEDAWIREAIMHESSATTPPLVSKSDGVGPPR